MAWNSGTGTGGIAYTPATNSWSILPPAPLARGGRSGAAMVWTGREVVIWGGWSTAAASPPYQDGAAYLPPDQHLNGLAPVAGLPRPGVTGQSARPVRNHRRQRGRWVQAHREVRHDEDHTMPQRPAALFDHQRGALAPASRPPPDQGAGSARPAARADPAAPPAGRADSVRRSPRGKRHASVAGPKGMAIGGRCALRRAASGGYAGGGSVPVNTPGRGAARGPTPRQAFRRGSTPRAAATRRRLGCAAPLRMS